MRGPTLSRANQAQPVDPLGVGDSWVLVRSIVHAGQLPSTAGCDQVLCRPLAAIPARLLRKTGWSPLRRNDAHDLARRPPAPHRCRRSFRRCGHRAVAGSDRRTRQNDRRLRLPCRESARRNAGPLRGIAVGIKDIIDTADFPTEMGSPIYRGFRPRADAPVVSMLKRAGATIIGKTTTTRLRRTTRPPPSIRTITPTRRAARPRARRRRSAPA